MTARKWNSGPPPHVGWWLTRVKVGDRLLSALRKLVNEPQDITSKAYQHALGVLGEFEGNPPAKRRSASA